ncbi:MAG: phosphoglycerate dehydrogenase [Candidatus Devosia phytovorans]|uniref:Phosphoglycerate dehydrogenase n=1 Tax=Candidatus Devosia phytovorans TaxID=3121372 RepID=A0AAJ6AZF7_9HYPH|nr:phosphoglycerate dehydrogenase [Devosia sp.]WEK03756.1 MAG: phosphoglycerate dehydrogenase [Devosia sp.]
MTVIATTSPGFGRFGQVPAKLEQLGWEVLRGVDTSLPDGGLGDALARADFLITGLIPVDDNTLAKAPKLRAVLKHGVGTDNIDIAACTARGIPVLNTPASNSNAVAELAVAAMFSLARNVPAGHMNMLEHKWVRMVGSEVSGKTLGVVGLGNIGKLLAKKAIGLGMRVVATDLYPDRDFATLNAISLLALDDLLSQSDYVSLHVFGTETLITADKLALMKPTACLLNLARGEVVDLDALNHALSSKKLGGVALDAFVTEPPDWSHPIFSQPRAVFTPHMGADTTESVERTSLMNIADIETMLTGGRPSRMLNRQVFEGKAE